MEKWIKLKLDEINKLYEEGKVEPLSEFARGMASGIRQTFLWLSDSGTWMDPIETIPGLEADVTRTPVCEDCDLRGRV